MYCQEPSCLRQPETLERHTVAPGIYLWLCRKCVAARRLAWIKANRPALVLKPN